MCEREKEVDGGCLSVADVVDCPLIENMSILQQPADLLTLTEKYVSEAKNIIQLNSGQYDTQTPDVTDTILILQRTSGHSSSTLPSSTHTSPSLPQSSSPTPL